MASSITFTQVPWSYVTDKNVSVGSSPDTVVVGARSYIVAQKDNAGAGSVIVGGATPAAGTQRWPTGGKLRRALMRWAGGPLNRMVVVHTPTAPLITQPPGFTDSHTLNLNIPKTATSQAFAYEGQFITETRARRGVDV